MMKLTLRVLLSMLGVLALQSVALARPHPTGPHPTGQHGRGTSTGMDTEANALVDRAVNDLGHHGLGGVRHHNHHSHGHPRTRHHQRPNLEIVQLCGSKLSDALRSLCKGRGYNTMDNAGSGASRHGHGGGLVNECCHVGCSLEQLDKYCQPRKNPLPLRPLSESTESASESVTMEVAHQANHIRPMEAPSENITDQNLTPMPTVVGGRVTNKLNVTQLEIMDSSSGTNRNDDMVMIGTIPLRHQIPVTVPKRQQGTSNSL